MSRSRFRFPYGAWAGALLLLSSSLLPLVSQAADRYSADTLFPHRRGSRVVFSIEASATARVHLIGDFNDWNYEATPMEYAGDGVWEVALKLDEGTYDYKFVVDGRMRLDSSNPNEVTVHDGSVRSRIKVLRGGRVSSFGRWEEKPRIPKRLDFSPREHTHLSIGGDISFTRVDGSTFGLNLDYTSSYDFTPRVQASFNYGWESERTSFRADFAQPLLAHRRMDLGVVYQNGTGYENQSGIGRRENTLAALFFKHDFNDYYEVQGFEPYVRLRFPLFNSLRASYAIEDYESLTTQTNWSFFKAGRDQFRPNPHLFLLGNPEGFDGVGRLEAARLEWIHDSRRARHVGTVGLFTRGFLELGNGDFSYGRWIGDTRAYMRLGPPVHLALRFRASGRFGNSDIPSQKLFYMGGLGTVRGQEFRSQVGDHSLLGNAEYTLLFGQLNYGLLFFYDFGTAWNSLEQNLDESTLLQSVGFGLKSADNDFQIHFAQPIGEIQGKLETTVRLTRSF